MDLIADANSSSAIEKCLLLERRFFLSDHNLLYTDKMSMAAGVEVRVPLLDLELVKFAAEVPTSWKMGLFKGKKVLRDSQRGILPNSAIDRHKTGFGVPLRNWMRNGMKELVDDLLSKRTIKHRGLFDDVAVQNLRDADLRGRVDASYTLFSLMCIELWGRRFIDTGPMSQHVQ